MGSSNNLFNPRLEAFVANHVRFGLSVEHRFEFADGEVEIIVDDDVIEILPTGHVAYGIVETPLDDGVAVCASVPEPPFQFVP